MNGMVGKICLVMVWILLSLGHHLKAQDTQSPKNVRFELTVVDCDKGLQNGEIGIKSLEKEQQLVWHLFSIDSGFEKIYIKGTQLKGIPAGEYSLVVRDNRPNGNRPVIQSIFIKN
jgi:hypothetical protein